LRYRKALFTGFAVFLFLPAFLPDYPERTYKTS